MSSGSPISSARLTLVVLLALLLLGFISLGFLLFVLLGGHKVGLKNFYLVLPVEPRVSHDHPSCSIPSYIGRHTDTELRGVTAENALFLAIDEDADDTGVAVLSGDSTRDLLGGVNGFGGLDTEMFSQEGDAFWSPLNLPEVLRLERGNLLPALTLLEKCTHLLEDVTRDA